MKAPEHCFGAYTYRFHYYCTLFPPLLLYPFPPWHNSIEFGSVHDYRMRYSNISSIPVFQNPQIPTFQYPNIPIGRYSNIPVFQYPGIPIFQYSNRPIWSSHASPLLALGAREKRYGRLLGKVLYRSGG